MSEIEGEIIPIEPGPIENPPETAGDSNETGSLDLKKLREQAQRRDELEIRDLEATLLEDRPLNSSTVSPENKLTSLAPFEIYKDPDSYEASLREMAKAAGIELEHGFSIRYLFGFSGKTLTIGQSGRVYKAETVNEPIAKIIYYGRTPPVRIHELTHVEQRLRNPTWQGTSLEEIEIQALERSLKATGGWKFPLNTFNQLSYLAYYRLKLRIKKRSQFSPGSEL